MDVIEGLKGTVRVAQAHDTVWNSECAYTFHSPYTTDQGILVSLTTFMGTYEARDEGLYVRIVKKRVEKPQDTTAAPTKLGVGVQGGFDDSKYQIQSTHSIVALNAKREIVAELPYTHDTKSTFPLIVTESVDSILNHAGTALQQDVQVWQLDQDTPVSKFAENLPFVDNGVVIDPDPATWKCQKSGDTENLWLNLSDGYIGGGRKNWDGSGGSNGALDHYEETGQKYPLVVKLGTITADLETCDCYSYAKEEDGPVKIPNLPQLLEKRGIHIQAMKKTEKSTAELEVELNATYAFDAITEAGSHLVPVSGAGLQGLQNLGNSCYMNSVLQWLLSGTVPELAHRYGTPPGQELTKNPLFQGIPPKDAIADLLCQTAKVSSALTSAVFAVPDPNDEAMTTDPKYRLAPRALKHLVGKNHVEFRTNHQQDSAQFLQYLLEQMDRAELANQDRLAPNAKLSSHLFSFRTTSRLLCSQDDRIKYKDSAPETIWSLRIPMDKAVVNKNGAPEQKRPKTGEEPVPTVAFQDCIEDWAAEAVVDGYRWPHLNNAAVAGKQTTRFTNFPRYLIVQIQRYTMGADWTPVKLEVNLEIPQELDLNQFKSTGPQEGENLVPDDAKEETKPPSKPTIDEAALGQLMDMGFSMNGCKRALTAVGGSDVEAATNWVFEHNMDPDFNDPLPEDSGAVDNAAAGSVDDAVAMSLVESLGCFTLEQVKAALQQTNGAADRAADWLFSHMDDLDGAIAALKSSQPADSSPAPAVELEDGDGKYTMIGMISHIGKHTGSGHYVAHVKRDDKWVIFNDEKVAISESPPFVHAYMYLFQRKDADSPHPDY